LDDSSGRWLVGTAIDGMVILWDVHMEKMVEKCKLGTLQYVTQLVSLMVSELTVE